MKKCWKLPPTDRPRFSDLVTTLDETLSSVAGYTELSMTLLERGRRGQNGEWHEKVQPPPNELSGELSPYDIGKCSNATDQMHIIMHDIVFSEDDICGISLFFIVYRKTRKLCGDFYRALRAVKKKRTIFVRIIVDKVCMRSNSSTWFCGET